MYKHLLVPIDGSPFSARALPVAAAIARRTGAALHLAIVHDPSNYVPFAPGEVAVPVFNNSVVQKRRAEDLAFVNEQAAAITATGLVATGTLLEGTIVEALAEHAVDIGADLIVMTSHGRSGLDRLWLGSVAAALLSRAPAPVFLVRPTGPDAPTPEHQLPTGTVLIPLDGSHFAETALPPAQEFAEALGLKVELLSVIVPHAIPMAPFGTEALLADESDLRTQETEARRYLERLAATIGPDTQATVVTDTVAARGILDAAASRHPGVIAMSTHGRTGLMRMVLGSVADKVLRGADQPLLIYRPDSASK